MQIRSKLLTVAEAAEKLSLKPKTLRAWIGQKRITVVRPGGWTVRIPETEVDRIIEEGSVNAIELGTK
jgi:excisionase family DNA binding protein